MKKCFLLLILCFTCFINHTNAQDSVPKLFASISNLDFQAEVNVPVQKQVNIGLTGLPLLWTITDFAINITGDNSDQFSIINDKSDIRLIDLFTGNFGITVSYNPSEEGEHSASLEIQAKLLGFELPLKIGIPLSGKTMGILKLNVLTEAYIYGFPLVMAELTKRLMTNVETPNQVFAPINQFGHATTFLDDEFTAIVGVNADTYGSLSWLDLSDEPIVIYIPNTNGRYYLLPILDAFSNVFASPGSRTTGTEAQTFLVTGPSWEGDIPEGMIELKSPTNMAWVIGRILAYDEEDGRTVVKSIQDGMDMRPLSAYGNASYTPPTGSIDPSIRNIPPSEAIFELSVSEFFNLMNKLLIDNPPASYDTDIIERMKSLGVGAGLTFNLADYTLATQLLIAGIPSVVKAKLLLTTVSSSNNVNTWGYIYELGAYEDNYDLRAAIAYIGYGANTIDDTLYGVSLNTTDMILFNGAIYNYKLHFEVNEIPPVHPDAFWSISAYSTNGFFTENEIGRYSIGSRNSLYINEDGSIDLYFQHTNPGKDKENNWLPVPNGGFRLSLRLYWPSESALNQEWRAPAPSKSLRILSDEIRNPMELSVGKSHYNQGIENSAIDEFKHILSEVTYNISGVEVNKNLLQPGTIYIRKIIYEDGTSKIIKFIEALR